MEIVLKALDQVWETVREIWPYLLLSVLMAAAMRCYIDLQHISRWLQKYRAASVFASTSVAVSTPLCSCGGGSCYRAQYDGGITPLGSAGCLSHRLTAHQSR
jgi:uncharacterized membrane protein YraQ (UPF0718 family)